MTNVMNDSGQESLAGGRYRSRELSTDLPDRLDILHRSHRNFCARAMQELHRAERYRQYVSLVLVSENQLRTDTVEDRYRDITGPLADLASLVRVNTRVTDLVSGVEGGRFAILLVETSSEDAREYLIRLHEMIESLLGDHIHAVEKIQIPVELVSFPEDGANRTTLAEVLNDLYQRSSIRPHIF